jgi:pheromone shutdown protein TraB
MTEGPTIARVGAALALIGPLSALFAFMASPTTSMTVLCAEALTVLLSLELGLRQVYAPRPPGAGPLAYTLTAVAFFASVVPIALGLFQTFAAIYAREARKVDVHRPSEPEKRTDESLTSD